MFLRLILWLVIFAFGVVGSACAQDRSFVLAGLGSTESGGEPTFQDDDDSELGCLARNIYWEAGHEKVEGLIAVARVTLNRANDSRYPKSICGVVHQGGRGGPCQFGWYCSGRDDTPGDARAWRRAQGVARWALENADYDPTNGALFFQRRHSPRKYMTYRGPTKVIGNHVFWRY